MYRLVRLRAFLIFLICMFFHAEAKADVHDRVRKSLVHLTVSGTPKTGALASVPDAAQAQGTGFFFTDDGYILTTLHLFDELRKVEAVNVRIAAKVGGADAKDFPAQFISQLEGLDLAVLKMKVPFGTEYPKALNVGSTVNIPNSDEIPLFTSGFFDKNYTKLPVSVIEKDSPDIFYAWVVNVTTMNGQSGSPIYTSDGTVIGLIKGSSPALASQTLMIPIEYSQALIGYLKLDALEKKINELSNSVASISRQRLPTVEKQIAELGKKFSWHASTLKDGSLEIRYDKLLPGGIQIDRVSLTLTPYIRESRAGQIEVKQGISVKLRDNPPIFERTFLDTEKRSGGFKIAGVQSKLMTVMEGAADVPSKSEFFKSLEVIVVPYFGEKVGEPISLSIAADYPWN
ncbi:S1 family peptidase [Pararhizobium sp. O133]|uniref:S1 family peptidase n=1 Tax=Pararhizobium sp. O133 TaxID=3449278 RepID=UPI003F6830A2